MTTVNLVKIIGKSSWKAVGLSEHDDPSDITPVKMIRGSREGSCLHKISLDDQQTYFGFILSTGNTINSFDTNSKGRWLCAELTRVTNPNNEQGAIRQTNEKINALSIQLSKHIEVNTNNELCQDITNTIVTYLFGDGAPDVYFLPNGSSLSDHCKFKIETVEKYGNELNVGIQTMDGMWLRSPDWTDRMLQQIGCNGRDEHFNIKCVTPSI